jgi:hypothetical protein
MPGHGINMVAARGATSKSRAGTNFFGPNKSKVPLVTKCNPSFGSPGSSKTAKLEKLSQDFNSFGLDCKTKFSALDDRQAQVEFQVGNIHQGFQEMGNQINTINQGMGELSNQHKNLSKQCETEFANVFTEFGKTNTRVEGLATHLMEPWRNSTKIIPFFATNLT